MTTTVLITGATAGFGEATAQLMAASERNYRLIITGRRKDRLVKLQTELTEKYAAEVLPLCFDVQDSAAVERAIESLPEAWQTIDVLVNNAGLALDLAPVQEGDFSDWDTMIDTNVKGLLYVSKCVARRMIAQKTEGQIINIGSTAGSQVYGGGNVYCATKHAVRALTRGMRIDLLPHRIKVSSVNPGAAETEFSLVRFKGDVARASAVYAGYEKMVAQDVAELVLFVAERPPHICINEIEVTPRAQADSWNWFKG